MAAIFHFFYFKAVNLVSSRLNTKSSPLSYLIDFVILAIEHIEGLKITDSKTELNNVWWAWERNVPSDKSIHQLNNLNVDPNIDLSIPGHLPI